MFVRLLKLLATGYGVLLTLAAGGYVFANLAVLIIAPWQYRGHSAPDPHVTERWSHGGWIFGVLFALMGLLFSTIRKMSRWRSPDRSEPGFSAPSQRTVRMRGKHYGRLASTLIGGLAGAFLGAMLGASLLLIWFSLAYSPFAPQEWVASLQVDTDWLDYRPRHRSGITTRHSMALFALAVPIAIGTIAGAVFGGVAGVTEESS